MERGSRVRLLLKILLVLIIIIIAVLLYARYIEPHMLEVKEYKIVNEKLAKRFHGFKIAHISDIHYGRVTFQEDLEKIVEKINLLKPDIVVFTGDLIDQDTIVTEKVKKDLIASLSKIKANAGKYAVSGNHDYYNEDFDVLIESCGFTNLNDKYDTIYIDQSNYIFIGGMSTNSYGKVSVADKMDKMNDFLYKAKKAPTYSILLMHEPDFIDEIDTSIYNMVLSGHSHGGQIRLPFIGGLIYPKFSQKYHDSYYKVKDTDLYISNGIGTSIVNFRLLNRPSFNFYRLVNY